jgi:hypothetical protein
MIALIGFMPTKGEGAVAAIDCSPEVWPACFCLMTMLQLRAIDSRVSLQPVSFWCGN